MQSNLLKICVIGGGFTGVAAAIACIARLERPFRLTVVEPNAALGRGVAFGAHHPMLLNVRARDLSVFADRPGDFLNWAFCQLDQGENDAGLLEGLGHTFLPRQMFGEYVRQRLFESVEGRPDVCFEVVKASASECRRVESKFLVQLSPGGAIVADVVVVATAYGLTRSPIGAALPPFASISGEELAKARSLVLIGSGLTMADVLLNARREGFVGKATIVSRRGQLPRQHAPKGVVPKEMALPRTRHLSRLLSSVRIACEAAEAYGTPWQAVINGLRPSLQTVWQELGVTEQARFLRHVRPFWDAHRHRLPMELHERLHREFGRGKAELLRARVLEVDQKRGAFVLTVKRRGSSRNEILIADLAFDCTGHRPDLRSPPINSLIAHGLARIDPHNLGLTVNARGQPFGRRGTLTPGLFVLGPLGQGSLWEIVAVPEIVRQADLAASYISQLYDRFSQMTA